MQQRCYWDYARVYAPSGASLEETNAPWTDMPIEETDHTIWASSLLLAPGESTSLKYRYGLDSVATRDGRHWNYRLHVEKQAGTGAIPIQVTVKLPEGAEAEQATPLPLWVEENTIGFESSLLQDLQIEIAYTP
jgi:hypothetical protein